MSDASQFKVLRAGLNEHISAVSDLDGDDDDSVSEVNGRLTSFFGGVDSTSLPADHDELDGISKLFEVLNRTGFRKAKKHNLVYSPYLMRLSKDPSNGVKLNVLGADSAAFRSRPEQKKGRK